MAERATLKLALKLLLPIAIGAGVVVWLFGREFDAAALSEVHFSTLTVLGLVLSGVALFGRDFGLAWRFRTLTDRRLSWGKAAKVTMLCEFTSAITPTSAGGSALSMVFMSREGITGGRATAVTMTTLLLDELFFVIICPLVLLFMPAHLLFGFGGGGQQDLRATFWIAYGLICLITLVLASGIFLRPQLIAGGLVKMFSLPILRRWRGKVEALGADLVSTAHEVKGKSWRWWAEGAAATSVSWMSRFLVVNALFLAFVPDAPQMLVLGRQVIVWALLTFSPTPGGSGLSEWLFKTYYGDIIAGGMLMVIAIFWRILTYYVYLLVGFCMLPTFLNLKRKDK